MTSPAWTSQCKNSHAAPPEARKTKAPQRRSARGERAIEEAAPSAYFFAVKIYFETCDLWCDAVLRWMTLLFTALSRAELKAMAVARAFSASLAVAAAATAFARVFRRVLTVLLRAALRRDLRAALIADLVLAMT